MLEKLNTRKGRGCWPSDDPFSTDPAVWAEAYLLSGDWLRPWKTRQWFNNAMKTVNDDNTVYDSLSGED